MTNKYDDHRKFLQNILDSMNANLEDLENRKAILEDQIQYVSDAIQALKVYEHINSPTTQEVANA